MPCEKCEKKWGKIITPEVWRDGAKSSHKNSKLGENKFLTKVKKWHHCDLFKILLPVQNINQLYLG